MAQYCNLKYGEIVKCPSCKEKYSFCRCYECQNLIYEKNRSILGLSVSCVSCKKIFLNIICPNCNTNIYFLDRNKDIEEGEKIKCEKCSKEFVYQKNPDNNNEYSGNLFVLESIKGEQINFGKAQVDENYLSIENLMIKTNLYNDFDDNEKINEIKKSKKSNLCILCHCNIKESTFYPCGHMCACYKCAVLFFEINKKCPRCNSISEAIVPKIYE